MATAKCTATVTAQTVVAKAVPRFVWQRAGLVPSLILGATFFALAWVSASSSLTNALARRSPEAAAQLWPANGFATASAASAILAKANAGRDGTAKLTVPTAVRGLAERAILAEPASVQGVRNLALFHQANGDNPRAATLMRLAVRLSARDTAANMWLVEAYLRGGDLDRALTLIDATLRTDTSAGALLLPRLAQLLEQPGAAPVMRGLLQDNPPWGHDYWSAVIEAGNAPIQAADLRGSLHRQGVPLAAGHDARLIEQLVEAHSFAAAFALYNQVRGAAQFPPIDWKLADGRGIAVSRSPDGTIRASALSGSVGVVAQRLIALPRGRYTMHIESSAASGQLVARLTCAELQGARTLAVDIPITQNTQASFDQTTACRYAWLTLSLDPTSTQADPSITIGSVSLRPAAGGA